MAAIFLSYAREDRSCAEKLAAALETAGHDVWWDRHLDGGEEFSAEIEAALDKAEAVVVAWSKESIRSRWVRDEAAAGCEKGVLVPLSIDGSLPPMGFRQFHTMDFNGWKGARGDGRTQDFLHAIERRLKPGDAGAPRKTGTQAKARLSSWSGHRMWKVLAVVVLAAAVAVGAYFFVNRDKVAGAASKPTIALLPFKSPAGDGELSQLASQSRESIAHTFSQSGMPIRVMDSVSAEGGKAADFLISGEVSRAGEKVLVSIRLDEAAHRVTVFSDRFEASGEDTRNLPERIGAQLAGNLTWGAPLAVLDRSHPMDPAIIAELLRSADFNSGLDSLQSYQKDKGLAAREPNLGMAQLNLAFSTGFVLSQLPRAERREAVAQARVAAERALKLRPDFGDTYATWCVLHSWSRIAECEDRLREGKRVDPDAPFLNTFLSHRLRDVGKFEESDELARMAYSHDVYVPTKLGWVLKTLEFSGEREAAQELFDQGTRWWPDYEGMFYRNRVYGLIQRGDFESLPSVEKNLSADADGTRLPGAPAIAAAVKSKSVAALRRACPDGDNYVRNMSCMLAFAKLGDLDRAYAIADRMYPAMLGRTPAETESIFLNELPDGLPLQYITSPAAAPMRRDPRYLKLAQRVGLLEYWRGGRGRAPDFCRETPEPICAQLRPRT